MALDRPHSVGSRRSQNFTRKSQIDAEHSAEHEGSSQSTKLVVVAALFLSIGLIGGFFVVNHFVKKATLGMVSVDSLPSAYASPENVKASTPEVLEKEEKVEDVDTVETPVNSLVAVDAPIVRKAVDFSFYKGLSETEVVVDAEPISVTLPSPYYIQAGTFVSRVAAHSERDRLASKGLAMVVSVYKGKRIYHRLRMGPFMDRLELNKQRNILHDYGVDTLLIRTKNKPVKKSLPLDDT